MYVVGACAMRALRVRATVAPRWAVNEPLGIMLRLRCLPLCQTSCSAVPSTTPGWVVVVNFAPSA